MESPKSGPSYFSFRDFSALSEKILSKAVLNSVFLLGFQDHTSVQNDISYPRPIRQPAKVGRLWLF